MTVPSAGTRPPRTNKENITGLQLGKRNDFDFDPSHTFGSIREQRRKRIERAASLRNGPHLQPVSQDHDRDERNKFPPDLDLKQAECSGEWYSG